VSLNKNFRVTDLEGLSPAAIMSVMSDLMWREGVEQSIISDYCDKVKAFTSSAEAITYTLSFLGIPAKK
jgi:hypothetical protein